MANSLETTVVRVRSGSVTETADWVAVERALEIRARVGGVESVVSTTMRTPGEDGALAVGFLFSERVVNAAEEVLGVESIDEDTVVVTLAAGAEAALEASRRPFVTSGACGVCGRGTIDGLMEVGPMTGADLRIAAAVVHGLPVALRAAQAAFARTGGLHAAGLFSPDGVLRSVHEDVGRHNAVDKLVGTRLLQGSLPGPSSVLVVSGRASFELVQKAARAGIPVMAAVGAPSTLAVEVARSAGITLLGFVRDDGFNIYCGAERVLGLGPAANGAQAGIEQRR